MKQTVYVVIDDRAYRFDEAHVMVDTLHAPGVRIIAEKGVELVVPANLTEKICALLCEDSLP